MRVSVIVLAGGFSSRMGTDKGLVPFRGKPMIERSLELAKSVSDTIIIVANHDGYDTLGYPVVEDILKEKGPIGGIHSGLSHSSSEYNLVLACDMPLMNPDFLRHLLKRVSTEDEIVVPRYNDNFEPLCAVYSKNCIPDMETAARSNDLSLHSFIRSKRAKIVDVKENMSYYSPYLFTNVNSKEELAALEASIKY